MKALIPPLVLMDTIQLDLLQSDMKALVTPVDQSTNDSISSAVVQPETDIFITSPDSVEIETETSHVFCQNVRYYQIFTHRKKFYHLLHH